MKKNHSIKEKEEIIKWFKVTNDSSMQLGLIYKHLAKNLHVLIDFKEADDEIKSVVFEELKNVCLFSKLVIEEIKSDIFAIDPSLRSGKTLNGFVIKDKEEIKIIPKRYPNSQYESSIPLKDFFESMVGHNVEVHIERVNKNR